MAAGYWIKLYQDILRDPKMGRLSDSAWRRCIELFLLAGEQDCRDGYLPAVDDIAWELRISTEQLGSDLAELEKAGVLLYEDGQWLVKNFAKRQAAVSGAERVRQFRKKAAENPKEEPETDGNTPETAAKVAETELKPAGNDSVTKGYTDKDIDKQDKITRAREGEGEAQNEYEMLKAAVCEVTKKSILLLGNDDLLLLDRLFKAGHTAGQVLTCYGKKGWWYLVWWKGKKLQYPTIQDIADTIGQAIEWKPGTAVPLPANGQGNRLYNEEVVPFLSGSKPFSQLSRQTQEAIKAIGESNVRRMAADSLQRKFVSLVSGH